jgi:hypothetical protein
VFYGLDWPFPLVVTVTTLEFDTHLNHTRHRSSSLWEPTYLCNPLLPNHLGHPLLVNHTTIQSAALFHHRSWSTTADSAHSVLPVHRFILNSELSTHDPDSHTETNGCPRLSIAFMRRCLLLRWSGVWLFVCHALENSEEFGVQSFPIERRAYGFPAISLVLAVLAR